MEEDNIEEKQNYLRENILEKGYNPNEFVDFLKSKKGEAGSDISNWSMDDLKEVVQEFVSKNAPLENSEPPSEPPSEQNKIQIETKNTNTNAKINKSRSVIPGNSISISLTEEDYGLIVPDYVECIKSETTELSKYDNIEITVTEPKKINNGFFSKAFINYLITTNQINGSVRRKHADFFWLKERLSTVFNLNVMPRLPKKGKVNEDKHINKRMRNLEKFLMYLAKDPLIKNSKIFYDFLTIENDSDFEKKKKIYNKMKTPLELKDITTIDGKMKVQISSQKEQFLENIKNNASFNETALKKFNTNFKVLKEEMNIVIKRILTFGPLFDKMIKISTTFLDNKVIIESYNQMKNIFNTWAETLKKQNSFFMNDVKEYLKFLSGNYHHMRDLVQIVELQKSNYNKIARNLISKKIDLFRKGEVANWQLDTKDKNNINSFYSDRLTSYKKICFKETNNVIKLKEKYGYHLNKVISEYQRMRKINTLENKEKVIQFSKKESQFSSDYFKVMGEIIGIMEECVEKPEEEKNQPSMEINYEEENSNNIEENINQNKIDTEVNEDKNKETQNEIKEENIEEKKEEIKNEIKEEKKDEINVEKKEEKEEKTDDKKDEKENENEIKEERIEEKKEEKIVDEKKENRKEEKIEEKEDKIEDKIEEEKKEEKIEDEKKEDRKEDKIEDKIEKEDKEDKKEELIEEKKNENIENIEEKKDEEKKENHDEKNE